MAQVFLSYDREDGAKARVIAQALERAGHFVWWDLHIKGGAEYGKVIEEALDQSDAVVVLWSSRSVNSAWVRDEAAAGRDKGCLIPVLTDPVSPPMGFRQYQNLDFTNWKGRGKPPRLAELLASIEALGGRAETREQPAGTVPAERPAPHRAVPKWALIGGAALLAMVAIGLLVGLVVNDPSRSRDVRTVAVAAADAEANPLARDLLVNLGRLHSAKSGSVRLVGAASAGQSDADLIFEAAGDNDPDRVGASLVLMDGKDRSILWSKDFTQESGSLPDLKLQVAYTAAKVLECAMEGSAGKGAPLQQDTLKLYLNGCSTYSELVGGDPQTLLPVFREIVARVPRFEDGWAKLLAIESEIISSWDQEDYARAIATDLREHMAEARKLNPDMAELLLAEADLLPPTAFKDRLQIQDRAVQRNPDSAAALSAYSAGLRSVGRMIDGIEFSKRAVDLDPLSPIARDSLVTSLTYAGRTEEALEELRQAEQLWPGASSIVAASYRLHLRYGDPEIAFRIQRAGDYGGPHRDAFLQARLDPSSANIDKAISFPLRWFRQNPWAIGELMQVYGAFGREEELFPILLNWSHPDLVDSVAEVLFRPALRKLHHDPRMIVVSQRLGLLAHWRQSGKWPDFCFEPDLPYDCKTEAAKLR